MTRLVLIRHGESIWNKENRFTGWTDVGLTDKGIQEAHEAAEALRKEGFTFDAAFTSVLKRAIKTMWIILEGMDLMWIPVYKTWRLNEKHYGALQGLNKRETAARHGFELVHTWRRSYDIPPPPLRTKDKRHPIHDPRYASVPRDLLPGTESLKTTLERVLPCWHERVAPTLHSGKRVLISAHGNSIRALVKYLDKMSYEEIPKVNIPTGIPLIYELDDDLYPLKHYYLADEETVRAATTAVEAQLKEN